VPELSIIIVNWNSKDFLRQCLASMKVHCHGVSLETIVVDGGSFDGCGEMLAREFSSVIFIQSDKNIGFARANNLGARRASGHCLLFLNPDTEFFEDSLCVLMEQLRTLPQAGLVGCRLLNSDRSLQTSCVQAFPTVCNQVLNSEFLRRQFPGWKIWGMAALFADPARPAAVQVISGACILARRDVFEAVGGFTGQYFMYGEDADLCRKIARAGHRVYYAPQTSIVHHCGSSSRQAQNNFSNIMLRESIYRFLKLNHGKTTAAAYRVAMSVLSVVRLPLILVLLPISRGKVVRHGAGSLRKWFSILRWGLGLESWVRTYPETL
jgi:GT2 family glycosyltransferase